MDTALAIIYILSIIFLFIIFMVKDDIDFFSGWFIISLFIPIWNTILLVILFPTKDLVQSWHKFMNEVKKYSNFKK